MSEHDFQFFGNLMIFFSKHESDQVFLFHIYFSHLCEISNPKKSELVIKLLEVGHRFEKVEEKIKRQKMNVIFFPTKLG
jgi:hypothetical protein